MKTLEYHYGGNIIDRVLNAWPFCLHVESIKPLLAFVVCRGDEKIKAKAWIGRQEWDGSLYHNGWLFFRLMLPFYIGVSIRWSAASDKRAFLQAGVGWKLNGRLAITFRIQSDESAARGTWGPNLGQAKGFDCGNK